MCQVPLTYMHTVIQAYPAYTAHTECNGSGVGALRSTPLGCEIDVRSPILLHRISRTTGTLQTRLGLTRLLLVYRSPTGSQLLYQPRFTVSKDLVFGSLLSTEDTTMDSRFTISPGQGFFILHFTRTSVWFQNRI